MWLIITLYAIGGIGLVVAIIMFFGVPATGLLIFAVSIVFIALGRILHNQDEIISLLKPIDRQIKKNQLRLISCGKCKRDYDFDINPVFCPYCEHPSP